MKNYQFSLCFFLLIISSFGSYAIDIISYDIKANCDLNKRLINITANLQIEKVVNDNLFKILLGSWSKINSLKSGDKIIKFSRKSFDNDTLIISVPEQFKKDKKFILSFNYTLFLDSLDLKNKNVVFMQRATLWYPLQYDDIASMKLDIIAPKNYNVFSTGNLINKKNVNNNIEYSYENNLNDRYAIFIFSDTINTTLTKYIDNIKINFFFVSKDTATNNKIIKEVCNSFSFYNKYIGSYKYNQLNIVEIPHPQMMYAQALSSLLLIGSPFLNAYKLDGNWPIHEVAHQWWGCSIFFNSKAKGRLFLEESVNEFFKVLCIENIWGNDSLKNLFKSYHDIYKEIDNKNKELPILKITNVSTMNDGYVIYQKGPLVVNKLRNLMGNESYEKFIKEIYNSYIGKLLTYDDFIKTLSKYDKKNNLVKELNKWLSETGFTD